MAGQIQRTSKVVTLNFEASATQHTEEAVWVGDCSSLALICDSDFDGDTLTLKTTASGDTGFTVTAATGRVNLDSDQALAFFPMQDLIVTTDDATAAAATITLLLKG